MWNWNNFLNAGNNTTSGKTSNIHRTIKYLEPTLETYYDMYILENPGIYLEEFIYKK